MTRICLMLMLVSFVALPAAGQPNWELAKQHDGIKVFLKNAEGTGIKMLRVECDVPGRQEAIFALLMDVPASEKWIPQTKIIRYLRPPSPVECLYYSELDMPWPVSNRDYVVHLKAWQQQNTKLVIVDADVLRGEVPEKEGVVRIYKSTVKWIIYPTVNGHTKLIYQIFTDPGGNIPTSLVNYFAKQAAIDIVKKLRELVLKPPYRDASLPFGK